MNPQSHDRSLDAWVSDLLDGELTPQQERDLLAALQADPAAGRRVLDLVRDDCLMQVLHDRRAPEAFAERVLLSAGYLDTGESFTDRVTAAAATQDEARIAEIRQQAERQLDAFLAQHREAQAKRSEPRRPEPTILETLAAAFEALKRLLGTGLRVAKVAGVFLLAAIVILTVFLYVRANRIVARVVASQDAKWDVEIDKTGGLRSQRVTLEEGYAQIALTQGAQVILQAPTTFKVQGPNRMFVEAGCITARAEGQAKGFTAYSPTATVKDFGTEFGLLVGSGSVAEVQVFDGGVSLEATRPGRRSAVAESLRKGESLAVDGGGRMERGAVDERSRLFVREMPTTESFGIPGRRLDLADMVGGGNGLGTGTWGTGLYPATGEVIAGRRGGNSAAGTGFRPAPASRGFVDGVFVPDGGSGPVTISSSGLTFSGCPDTSGQGFDGILNGAVFRDSTDKSGRDHNGRLAGQVYGTPQHPSIGMHANAGITFDLAKIRAATAEAEISRFHSLCGISETATPYTDGVDPSNGRRVAVDFVVVVDGQQRFSRRVSAVPSETAEVDVPLARQDRFLTLMALSPNTVVFCWGLWAEPSLDLRQRRP